MLKSIFNFFIFSSFYIAICAVIMVYQLQLLFPHIAIAPVFYVFVFFSTVCSYNFHWWLTVHSAVGSERLQWAVKYKWLHLLLYFAGLIGAAVSFFMIRQHWLWIALGIFVTFLYSAPKIPQKFFIGLRRIAIGKTIFLAFVWMYVTTFLPIAIDNHHWNTAALLFCVSRFLLIYAICIIFDYRDRDYDKQAGIRSMITYFNEKGINNLFAFSLAGFAISTLLLYWYELSILTIVLLLIPGGIVAALYKEAKKNFSDYLYYFVLDGLMMFSSLLTIFIPNK